MGGGLVYGQDYRTRQEVHVSGLPALMALLHEPSDVLLTSLDTIVHDSSVCCGKDSALGDSALREPNPIFEIHSYETSRPAPPAK